ncbi:MAG: glycosyltransferase family 4 protein [Candidatus Babeliales bacterium]|jgi:glycosyltransferase involved in cell wall biosynthesis
MNVVISAGGRFHAHHLAYQLALRKSLCKFFTFDYTPHDTSIPSSLVHVDRTSKLFNDYFVKLQLARFIAPAQFNVFKDNLFDRYVSKKLTSLDSFDLFVGWAHYAEKSLAIARRIGAKIIIESGSCHILEQQRILQEEYQRWGLTCAPIHSRTVAKMCNEYQKADYIMTLSSFAQRSFIAHGIAHKRVLMVPCGVDVEYFLHDKPKRAASQPRFRVIFVGLISLRKGVQYLLDAWNKLKLPKDSELLLVGTMTKDFASIISRLHIPANVTFTGPVDRPTLRTLYQEASLFVLPSLEDGFGMVIGEAMASGLPVICSSTSAGPELITDGTHGFIYNAYNSKELAEKIDWCYRHKDEIATMGKQGQQRICSFSWDIYGNNIYQSYTNLFKDAI